MPETKLNVKLLSHTVTPEITIALGGRLCYSDSNIEDLREAAAPHADEFIGKLLSSSHLSPIEHASFTFGAEGVSRALLAQITRHRIASFSVQSQRYVRQEELNYIIPESIKALGDEAVNEYKQQMAQIHSYYLSWLDKGIKAEDARFVLPNAAETRMVFTMNARELMHFFSLRCCNRAQWEIRRLAWIMLAMARREAPALFEKAGASCLSGACPEGRMCCKKQAQVKELSDFVTELAKNNTSDNELVKILDFDRLNMNK